MPGTEDAYWQFVVQATCDANTMVLFNSEALTFTKESAASLIVGLDLVGIVFFWLALICVKPFVALTEETVKKDNLSGPDFTVTLTQLPYLDKTEDLRPIYW